MAPPCQVGCVWYCNWTKFSGFATEAKTFVLKWQWILFIAIQRVNAASNCHAITCNTCRFSVHFGHRDRWNYMLCVHMALPFIRDFCEGGALVGPAVLVLLGCADSPLMAVLTSGSSLSSKRIALAAPVIIHTAGSLCSCSSLQSHN